MRGSNSSTILEQIEVTGPTMASILHHFSSAKSDVDGLLFGTLNQKQTLHLPDENEDPSSTPASDLHFRGALIPTVTGFFSSSSSSSSSSFFDSSGHVHRRELSRILSLRRPGSDLIGWFSGRRRTPLRPSLREASVSFDLISSIRFSASSINKDFDSSEISSLVFLLLATPLSDQIIHTHEYRAYDYDFCTDSFIPTSLSVVNIGPTFRVPYSSFCPSSSLPALPSRTRSSGSAMAEEGSEDDFIDVEETSNAQRDLDLFVEEFDVRRLSGMMGGAQARDYTLGLEDLYEKMLGKLEGLAKLVEKTC